jgi:hypothetical protein
VEPTQTTSQEHVEFDELCAEVEDFQPLPTVKPAILERDEDSDEHSVDGQLLAGLVSPV